MKIILYVGLFILFTTIVYQVNSLFNVNQNLSNQFGTSVTREKILTEKRLQEINEFSSKIKPSVDEVSNDVQHNLNVELSKKDSDEMVKFSKSYFGQAGRNYRVYYMKDERMVYLHRMWFDQIRSPASLINNDFPSIFELPGCCFVGEKEFFIVIPGTNIFKEIGHYRFDR